MCLSKAERSRLALEFKIEGYFPLSKENADIDETMSPEEETLLKKRSAEREQLLKEYQSGMNSYGVEHDIGRPLREAKRKIALKERIDGDKLLYEDYYRYPQLYHEQDEKEKRALREQFADKQPIPKVYTRLDMSDCMTLNLDLIRLWGSCMNHEIRWHEVPNRTREGFIRRMVHYVDQRYSSELYAGMSELHWIAEITVKEIEDLNDMQVEMYSSLMQANPDIEKELPSELRIAFEKRFSKVMDL